MRMEVVALDCMDNGGERVVQGADNRKSVGGNEGQGIGRKRLYRRLPWWRGKVDAEPAFPHAFKDAAAEKMDVRMSQRGRQVNWGGGSRGGHSRIQQTLHCAGPRIKLSCPQVETMLDVMQKRVKLEPSCLPSGTQYGCPTGFPPSLMSTSCARADDSDFTWELLVEQGLDHQTAAHGHMHVSEHLASPDCGQVFPYPQSPNMDGLQQMLDTECRRCLFVTFVMASGLRLVERRSCWPLFELFLIPWVPVHHHDQCGSSRWRRWLHFALKIGVALSTRFCSSFLGPLLTAHAFISIRGGRPTQTSGERKFLSFRGALMDIPRSVCSHPALVNSHGPAHPEALDKYPEDLSAMPDTRMFLPQMNDMAEGNVAFSADDSVNRCLVTKQASCCDELSSAMRSEDESEVFSIVDNSEGLIEKALPESLVFNGKCADSPLTLPAVQGVDQLSRSAASTDSRHAACEGISLALYSNDSAVASSVVEGSNCHSDANTGQDCTYILSVPAIGAETSEVIGGEWMQCQVGHFMQPCDFSSELALTKLSQGSEKASPLPEFGSETCAVIPCIQREIRPWSSCSFQDSAEHQVLESNEVAGCPLEGFCVNQGHCCTSNKLDDSASTVALGGETLCDESSTDQLLGSISQQVDPISGGWICNGDRGNENEDMSQTSVSCVSENGLDLHGTAACGLTKTFTSKQTGNGHSCLDSTVATDRDETSVVHCKADLEESWSCCATEVHESYVAETASLTGWICNGDRGNENEGMSQTSVSCVNENGLDLHGTAACGLTKTFTSQQTRNGHSCLDSTVATDRDETSVVHCKADLEESWSCCATEVHESYVAETASLTSSTSSSSLGFTDSEDEVMQSRDTSKAIQAAQDFTSLEDTVDGTTWHRTDAKKSLITHKCEGGSVLKCPVPGQREGVQVARITLDAPKPAELGKVGYSHSDHPTCVAMRSKRHANADQDYWSISDLQCSPWGQLVFWHGHCRNGNPTLCVLLGKAVCTLSPSLLGSLVPVIVSHMELAELSLFAGSAKQMNLLLDLSGLGLLRMPPMDILQRLGTVLNRDYAGRGGAVYVLNAPVMLSIVVSAVKGVILRPSYNKGAMIEKGFLDSKEAISVLGRRSVQALETHFEPQMIHSYFGGLCSCGANLGGCNVGYRFLLARSSSSGDGHTK